MVKLDELSKKTRDNILKTDVVTDEVNVGQKLTEQEAQKTLDISTSDVTFIQNDIYLQKILFAQTKPPLIIQSAYAIKNKFITVVSKSKDYKINFDAYAVVPGGTVWFLVDNEKLFDEALQKNNFVYTKKRSINIGIIYPIPGGLDKILSIITPNIDFLFQSLIGNVIIVPTADADVEPSLEAIRKLMGL